MRYPNETPQEMCIRLYTTTQFSVSEMLQAAKVSRPTFFRYLNQAGVVLNRRSPTLAPGINNPTKLGLTRRLQQTGAEPAVTTAAREKCIEADCLPMELTYLRAFRFNPEQVQDAFDILHSMNLTLISNCIGQPSGWGVWLAGPKHFTDPALNPGYPLNLDDCVNIIEDPVKWVTENAGSIKEFVTKKRIEMTEAINKLIG